MEIEAAIRASRSRASCDPVDLVDWSEGNPARGQCGVTALVLQDLLGGELLVADVHHADGRRHGVHYWNRIDGAELDLTREQFRDGEVIGAPSVVTRPADPSTTGRLAAQYRVLSAAVRERLH